MSPVIDPSFLCHGSVLREQERIQCTVPVLVWDQAETEAYDRAGGGNRSGRRRRGGEEEGDTRGGAGRRSGRHGGPVSTASVSLSVGERAVVWEDGVAYAPRWCSSEGDCDDGDACSRDACVKVRWRGGDGGVGRAGGCDCIA